MNICTSSYNAHRGISVPIGVGISASAPKFFTGPIYKKLVPSWDLINWFKSNTIDSDEYTSLYLNTLHRNKITPEVIISDLKQYGDFVTLLCWERAGIFCHRQVVAKFLMQSGLVNPIKEIF